MPVVAAGVGEGAGMKRVTLEVMTEREGSSRWVVRKSGHVIDYAGRKPTAVFVARRQATLLAAAGWRVSLRIFNRAGGLVEQAAYPCTRRKSS